MTSAKSAQCQDLMGKYPQAQDFAFTRPKQKADIFVQTAVEQVQRRGYMQLPSVSEICQVRRGKFAGAKANEFTPSKGKHRQSVLRKREVIAIHHHLPRGFMPYRAVEWGRIQVYTQCLWTDLYQGSGLWAAKWSFLAVLMVVTKSGLKTAKITVGIFRRDIDCMA